MQRATQHLDRHTAALPRGLSVDALLRMRAEGSAAIGRAAARLHARRRLRAKRPDRRRTWWMTSSCVEPSKGRRPVSAVNISTPNAQTSAACEQACQSACARVRAAPLLRALSFARARAT